jgi:hypothetical protein
MTYTIATMPVPRAVWDLIRQKLADAGYQHAIDDDAGVLDLTHVGLVPEGEPVLASRHPVVMGGPAGCWCLACWPMDMVNDPSSVRMALCPQCGNKRCPRANDHRHTCTESNEPGQPGSAYENCPRPVAPGQCSRCHGFTTRACGGAECPNRQAETKA